MFALLALVILAAQPDTPIVLESKTRYATEALCEAQREGTKTALEYYFKQMGGAEVQTKCMPTKERDI